MAPETQQALLARLPEYRLSKFQQALPDAFAVEMVGAYLLDVTGTVAFLRQTQVAELKPDLSNRLLDN